MIRVLRRVLALVLVLLVVFAVCYIIRTCKVIKGSNVSYESLQKSVYKSKNGNILIFSDENIWYVTEETSCICILESYENGTLIIQKDKRSYSFRVIDEETVYDMQSKEFMYRGGSG